MTRRITLFLLVGLLALCTARAAAGAEQTEPITFGAMTCAANWQPLNPGPARFRVTNDSGRVATVYLFHSASAVIATTVTNLKPGASRTVSVTLTPGATYSWSCDLRGSPVHVSDSQRIPQVSQTGGPGRLGVPVYAGELIGPLQAYRSYADRTLTTLGTDVARLSSAIAAGDLATAESDWLSAHLVWLDLGQDDGAYGAFGSLGQSIDGTAEGLVLETASPRFTGFHRIELDLWQNHDLTAAAHDTAGLAKLVAQLTPAVVRADTPGTVPGLTTFATRVHESLEDALRDTLTGDDDFGSATGLASVTADVGATRELPTLLAPLVTPRAPYLVARARSELDELISAVDATRVDGVWVAVGQLPERQRELVDARTDTALETLADIPGILALGGT